MHVLLTGASGFMGKNVAEYLLKSGFKVTAPVRKESLQRISPLKSYARFNAVGGAFWDIVALKALEETPDVIVHLAAIRGAGKASARAYERINVRGTQNLLDWARAHEVQRFLYVSTVGVLGTIPHRLPGRADDPPLPDGVYHQTKFLAEKCLRQINDARFKSLILRPTITYGPQDDGFLSRMAQLIRGGKMILPEKEVRIHLLDVFAFAQLIKQAIEGDLFNNQTYLVADEAPISLERLANMIRDFKGGRVWRLPDLIFQAGKKVSGALRLNALKTSLQLISESWYYDIAPAVKELEYRPVQTEAKIKEYLQAHVY
ncbi:NAD-dependent epimerase/dehydratase [Caldithrix abyssi DSM 13497]|uniref:NAD-dependent epimerase/dehydratase n=1 Tax=Caldithrix abyssi DSM 13497 TaxID=880073 RepID=H1XXE2_CALAY|nr:NAD-dependent epimerase/dehydratase family protein [Caldithrix abyssi]APF17860.1 UDP-glucose 4-epimerase [Caldithrix abyssi DSM 13497]EHO41927.1 NAD-dependent epimerase/dehydratase [Caldithrix abyssi DSM 13497]